MIWEVGGEIRRLPASIETPEKYYTNCQVELCLNSLMSLRHFDVLTISGYKIFFSTNIYSNKLCNISFERAQNMLYRKK